MSKMHKLGTLLLVLAIGCGGSVHKQVYVTADGGDGGAAGSTAGGDSAGAGSGGEPGTSTGPSSDAGSAGEGGGTGANGSAGAGATGGVTSVGSAGSASSAGGTTSGGGTSVAGSSSVVSCTELYANANSLLQAARSCDTALAAPQCTGVGTVKSTCGCPVAVDSNDSPEATAYLATVTQIAQQKCTQTCPPIDCVVVTSAQCNVTGGTTGTCGSAPPPA